MKFEKDASVYHRRAWWHRIVSVLACCVVFCTVYALIIPAITMEASPDPSVLGCTHTHHTHGEECYGSEGQLVCGMADYTVHIHSDSCFDQNGMLICRLAQLAPHTHSEDCFAVNEAGESYNTCGCEEVIIHTHTEDCRDETGALVCGLLQLEEHNHNNECYIGETSVAAGTFEYEDDRVYVKVNLPSDSGIPMDAKLCVTPVSSASPEYYDYLNGAQRAVEDRGNIEGIVLYDISFYTPAQQYIPVSDNAAVTMLFKNGAIPESSGQVAVLHYEEPTAVPETLEAVNVVNGQEEGISSLTFQTEGFSIFAIVKMGEGGITHTGLAGESYFMVCVNNRSYAITSQKLQNNTRLGSAQTEILNTNGKMYAQTTSPNQTMWTFVASNTAGKYYLYDEATGVYMTLSGQTLSTTTDVNRRTLFTAQVSTLARFEGMVRLACPDGNAINWYGGGNAGNLVFGGYNGNNDANEYFYLAKTVTESSLTYNMDFTTNKVGTYSVTNYGAWYSQVAGQSGVPTLYHNGQPADSVFQEIGNESDRLFELRSPNPSGLFIHQSKARVAIEDRLKLVGESPGKDFAFLGWETTDVNGQKVLIPGGAAVIMNAHGTITVNADGVHLCDIPAVSVLKAKWSMVSDYGMFFVNYSGTVLDTESDVTGRNQLQFTGIVGIARIYFGEGSVGDDDVFSETTNQSIRNKFVSSPEAVKEHDTANPCKIVMIFTSSFNTNYASTDNLYYYNQNYGINPSEFDSEIFDVIRQNNAISIKLSTPGNVYNPAVENNNVTSQNYEVRWYILKNQVDGWHVDGVVVADTSEISISDNYYGLTQQQVDSIINSTSMPVKLGAGASNYLNLSVAGLATHEGIFDYSRTGPFSARWVFSAVRNEQYTVAMSNARMLSGYEVLTETVHTYLDQNGQLQTERAWQATTAGLPHNVVSGTTRSIEFHNYYVPTGTAALVLEKQDAITGEKLSGAEFTLSNQSRSFTAVSDSQGKVYFSGIPAGNYTLSETSAPLGYSLLEESYPVSVTRSGSNVTARIDGDIHYSRSSGGGVQLTPFTVTNSAVNRTLTVTKTFEGLTAAEMQSIFAASRARTPFDEEEIIGYRLDVTDRANSRNVIPLTLDMATASADGFTFTWQVEETFFGDVVITEHHYRHPNHADVIVTAAQRADGTGDYDPLNVIYNRVRGSADIEAHLSDGLADVISISNRYIDTYELQVLKTDSSTGLPLENASFTIYGSYAEGVGTADSVVFEGRRYYRIADGISDQNGRFSFTGLKLDGSLYVLREKEAPAGYVTPVTYTPVAVSITDSDYLNGIYSLGVVNKSYTDTRMGVTAKTQWQGGQGTKAVLELYRSTTSGGNTVFEDTGLNVTLDGTPNGQWPGSSGGYEAEAWTAQWYGLPAGDGSNNPYTYYVHQREVNGYTRFYQLDGSGSTAPTTFDIGGGKVTVMRAADAETGEFRLITITNVTTAQFPETGGQGTLTLMLCGSAMVLGSLIYLLAVKFKRKNTR